MLTDTQKSGFSILLFMTFFRKPYKSHKTFSILKKMIELAGKDRSILN